MKIKIISHEVKDMIRFAKGRKKHDGFIDSCQSGESFVWDLWSEYDEIADKCHLIASGRTKTYGEATRKLVKAARESFESKK